MRLSVKTSTPASPSRVSAVCLSECTTNPSFKTSRSLTRLCWWPTELTKAGPLCFSLGKIHCTVDVALRELRVVGNQDHNEPSIHAEAAYDNLYPSCRSNRRSARKRNRWLAKSRKLSAKFWKFTRPNSGQSQAATIPRARALKFASSKQEKKRLYWLNGIASTSCLTIAEADGILPLLLRQELADNQKKKR